MPRGMWTAPATLPLFSTSRRVADVDDERVALADHLLRLRRRDARNDGVGGFH